MSIQRWLTASHNLNVVGDCGFWWAAAHRIPGVVPLRHALDQGIALVSGVFGSGSAAKRAHLRLSEADRDERDEAFDALPAAAESACPQPFEP